MTAWTGAWWRVGLAFASLLVAACAEQPASTAVDGRGGTGGTAGDGGAGPDGDASAPIDAWCGDRYGVLWDALEDAELGNVRLGQCFVNASGTTGALIVDSDGRIVDVTGTFRSDAPAKPDWLAMFASDRFPCFAGQTINYTCTAD